MHVTIKYFTVIPDKQARSWWRISHMWHSDEGRHSWCNCGPLMQWKTDRLYQSVNFYVVSLTKNLEKLRKNDRTILFTHLRQPAVEGASIVRQSNLFQHWGAEQHNTERPVAAQLRQWQWRNGNLVLCRFWGPVDWMLCRFRELANPRTPSVCNIQTAAGILFQTLRCENGFEFYMLWLGHRKPRYVLVIKTIIL